MDKQTLIRLVRNAGALLASDITTRVSVYVIYALVARRLGTQDFGRLSLGLTLLYSFQMLASAGVKTLLTREIAKDRSQTRAYMRNGLLLVVGMSLVSIAAMSLLGYALQYPPETCLILVLLSLSLLPISISVVFEAVFTGWERMHYVMFANAPINVLRIGLIVAVLTLGIGLPGVVLAMFASAVVLVGVEGILVRRSLPPMATPDKAHDAMTTLTSLKKLGQQSFTFVGIDFVIAAAASINYLVISKLANEANLGLFNAATQIISPITMLVQTLAVSLLPALSRQVQTNLAGVSRSAAQLLRMKLTFMLPLVIGLFYLCEPAFGLLYGRPEFVAASPLLRIIIWGNLCVVFTSVLGQTLVAGMREHQVLKLVLVIAAIEVTLNALLVSWLGVLGAAITMLVVRVAYVVPHIHFARAMLPGLSIAEAIKRPVVAALGMGLALTVAHAAGINAFVAFGISGVVFLGLLGLLHIDTVKRGLRHFAVP